MLAYRAPTLRVTVPGTPPVEGALVVVANTFTYAGIMRVASRARCDSGHLDVVVFPCGSVPSLTRYALAGWRHQVDRIQGVRYLTGDSVHIDSPAAVDVEVDGEYYGTTPVDITLKPATVPLLVPG